MTRAYPERNPFPHQATLSIEGRLGDEGLSSSDVPAPTLLLDPLRRMETLVTSYVKAYASGAERRGGVLGLRGDHGSGKTHAIYYVKRKLERQRESNKRKLERQRESNAPRPYQVYVKAEGSSFLEIYRTAMQQLDLPELQRLSVAFLGAATAAQVERDLGDFDRARGAAERLRRDPEEAYDLFSNYFVEEGAVEELHSRQVKQAAGGIEDFHRALSYLLESSLENAAYEWLCGRPISEMDRHRLGVSGPMELDSVGKWGLQLLAVLFSKVNQPFMLYIDQHEKLIVTEDRELGRQNMGRLHSLVEAIPRANGMLVVAGNEEAWRSLPRDLRDRFAGNIILFPVLSLHQAKELVSLYLPPFQEAAESSDAEPDIYPVTADGVEEIVRLTSGNFRRMLQLCALAFDRVFPDRAEIDAGLVQTTQSEFAESSYFDRDSVALQIEQLLTSRGLAFEQDYAVGQSRADYAVLAPDGSPVLVIRISEAIFHFDEAVRATVILDLVDALRAEAVSTHFMLVVLGYVSPEVTDALKRFVQCLIVYDSETFDDEFGVFVDRLAARPAATEPVPRDTPALDERLDEVREVLTEMRRGREEEIRLLDRRLDLFFERQAAAGEKGPRTRLELVKWLVTPIIVMSVAAFGVLVYQQQTQDRERALAQQNQKERERDRALAMTNELTSLAEQLSRRDPIMQQSAARSLALYGTTAIPVLISGFDIVYREERVNKPLYSALIESLESIIAQTGRPQSVTKPLLDKTIRVVEAELVPRISGSEPDIARATTYIDALTLITTGREVDPEIRGMVAVALNDLTRRLIAEVEPSEDRKWIERALSGSIDRLRGEGK